MRDHYFSTFSRNEVRVSRETRLSEALQKPEIIPFSSNYELLCIWVKVCYYIKLLKEPRKSQLAKNY